MVLQLLSSGADGLVKLWHVRSTECLNTFDGHEDKVWALTVGGTQEGLVATGGGDARVQVWEDCTLQDKAEAAEEEEVTLLKQQRLSNALQVPLLLHFRPPSTTPMLQPKTSNAITFSLHLFDVLPSLKSKSCHWATCFEVPQTFKQLTHVNMTRSVCDLTCGLPHKDGPSSCTYSHS